MLQTSGVGAIAPGQAPHLPPLQVWLPCLHAPPLCPHGWVVPSTHWQPSFAWPLQFSSSFCASQSSAGAGMTAPTHAPQAPLLHVWVPALHAPTFIAPQLAVAPSL